MNPSGDAAETMVRLSLQGTEFALKITGAASKNIAAMLLAAAKNQKKTKGKTTLNNLLKSGEELRVFSIPSDKLEFFQAQAKRYGVLYSALISKKSKDLDGMVDIMVGAKDAPMVNRIIKRFKLVTYDEAKIVSEITKTKEEKKNISPEEKLAKEIINKEDASINPNRGKTEKSPLSENSSKSKNFSEMGSKDRKKPSVKKELDKIKADMDKKPLDSEKPKIEHKQVPSKKKRKKKKER